MNSTLDKKSTQLQKAKVDPKAVVSAQIDRTSFGTLDHKWGDITT